jgi:hypothetical protein
MLEKNVGGLDRTVRFVAGSVLAVVGLAGLLTTVLGATVAAMALGGGAALLFNAVTQRCLMNKLLGIDTCPA